MGDIVSIELERNRRMRQKARAGICLDPIPALSAAAQQLAASKQRVQQLRNQLDAETARLTKCLKRVQALIRRYEK